MISGLEAARFLLEKMNPEVQKEINSPKTENMHK
jgi:hypothetical protein